MKDQITFVRKCANTKNRKTLDVQCALNATHGDFCSRHWKHPQRFIKIIETPDKLWELFKEYKEYIITNPSTIEKALQSGKIAKESRG